MEKVIDIEDRIPTLKARRRRRTNKKFSILLFLFISTILIVLYFQSTYSKIQTIKVDGASLVSQDKYKEQSSLEIGDSMWSFREKNIVDIVEQNDWVESVKVKRKGLTGIHIEIDEYNRVAFEENGNKLDIILENGSYLHTEGQVLPIDGPLFTGFKDEKVRKRMIKELNKLDKEVLHTISQINYTPTENDALSIQMYMNDGNEVKAIIPSFAEKMNFYPSIVSQLEPDVKGIIDLEVGTFFQSYKELYNEDVSEEEVVEDEEQTP